MQTQTDPQSMVSDAITTVTQNSFASLVLEAPGPIVVEFMSYGCAYCRVLEPVLQEVARMIAQSDGQILRVNVPIEPELADAYDVTSTPTLVMFLNGQVLGRVEGPDPTVAAVMSAVTRPFRAAR